MILELIVIFSEVHPLLCLLGVPAALFLAWVISKAIHPRARKVGFFLAACFAYQAFLLLIFASPLITRESIETFNMKWTIDEKYLQSLQDPVVVFEFESNPNYRVMQSSNVLASYLSDLGEPVVPVTFAVTRDLGRFQSFRISKVADLDNWQYRWQGTQSTGRVRAPW